MKPHDKIDRTYFFLGGYFSLTAVLILSLNLTSFVQTKFHDKQTWERVFGVGVAPRPQSTE
jgi:hypothetical protein